MIKTHRPSLLLSLLLASQGVAGVAAVRAGEATMQTNSDFKGQALSESGFEKSHLIFTSDFRVGYDDNTQAQPDSGKRPIIAPYFDPVTLQTRNAYVGTVNQDTDPNDSVFFNVDFGVGYNAATPRASLSLGADIGVNYYIDRPGRDYDINGGLTLGFSYKLTPRALLSISSYNAYTSSANFGASNLTNFSGQIANGTATSSGVNNNDQNGDFFYTSNRISLAYQWTQRFSTVTGYNLVAFAYRESLYADQQDRIEHYYSQEFRYLVAPVITAVGEYRLGYVDYLSDSTFRGNSLQNFALVGADFNLSQRLTASIRVGAQFRNYIDGGNNDNNDDSVSPYVEASANYSLSRLASVNFIARYSSEEGNVATSGNDNNTFRLGVSYTQALGARLSAYLSFYYTYSNYDGTDSLLTDTTGALILSRSGSQVVISPGKFDESSFDVAAGLRYSITRFLSAEAGYTHTTVLSGVDTRQYDRNRYFGGVRFSF